MARPRTRPRPVTIDSDDTATAAETLGWGLPSHADEFDGGLEGWNVYNGPGHAGKGVRVHGPRPSRTGC